MVIVYVLRVGEGRKQGPGQDPIVRADGAVVGVGLLHIAVPNKKNSTFMPTGAPTVVDACAMVPRFSKGLNYGVVGDGGGPGVLSGGDVVRGGSDGM